MNHFFSRLMNLGLKLILIPIICFSFVYYLITLLGKRQTVEANFSLSTPYLLLGQIVLISLVFILVLYIFNKLMRQNIDNIKYKKILSYILIFSFFIRFLWIITIKTVPVSDFDLIWNTSLEPYLGNFSSMYGSNYLARFPHLIITTLYFGLFRFVFNDNALLVVKIFNVLFSTLSVFGLSLLCKELFNKKMSLYAAIIMAISPVFIMYTSVTCSENMAMTFFIFSIYIYILVFKKKISSNYILLSGLLLSIGNLFRMVGLVIIVAYILHTLIYDNSLIIKVKNIALIILSFIIPLYIVSYTLVHSGISENHIFNGIEPNLTSILKGTNLDSLGGWTEEDALLPEILDFDKEKIIDASKEIIHERLSSVGPMQLTLFYTAKFSSLWGSGDFSAYGWATENNNSSPTLISNSYLLCGLAAFIHIILLLLTYYGLFNKDNETNSALDLIYLIFGGYWILYLITERQSRYGFIISFVFIIFALMGINKISKDNNIIT